MFMSTRMIFFILGGIGENELLFCSSAGLPDSCYLFTLVNILVARSTQKSKKQPRTTRASALFYNTKETAVGILQKLKSYEKRVCWGI